MEKEQDEKATTGGRMTKNGIEESDGTANGKKKKRFVIKKGECWQKRAVNRARIDATTWRL